MDILAHEHGLKPEEITINQGDQSHWPSQHALEDA
jgi:hypothetical protein